MQADAWASWQGGRGQPAVSTQQADQWLPSWWAPTPAPVAPVQASPAGGPSAAAALAGIAPQALCHSPSCALYIWIQALHDSYIENHCILQLIAITESCRSIISCLPSYVPAAGWTGWSLGCGRARCGVGGIHSARALQSRHT